MDTPKSHAQPESAMRVENQEYLQFASALPWQSVCAYGPAHAAC
jgi:hypothetical protein